MHKSSDKLHQISTNLQLALVKDKMTHGRKAESQYHDTSIKFSAHQFQQTQSQLLFQKAEL